MKMKNKLQPTRTTFSRNFQCKKASHWLSKFFHLGTENRGEQLKKAPCMLYSIEKHWEVGESRSSVAAVESMSSWGGPQSYPLQIKFSRQTLISSRTKLWVTWNGSRAAKTAQGIWIKNERILALWVITSHKILLLYGKKDLKSRLWSTA